MNAIELDTIGRLSDKADNLVHAARLPLTPQTHVECLSGGMAEIRDALRELYLEASGNNPWEETK